MWPPTRNRRSRSRPLQNEGEDGADEAKDERDGESEPGRWMLHQVQEVSSKPIQKPTAATKSQKKATPEKKNKRADRDAGKRECRVGHQLFLSRHHFVPRGFKF